MKHINLICGLGALLAGFIPPFRWINFVLLFLAALNFVLYFAHRRLSK